MVLYDLTWNRLWDVQYSLSPSFIVDNITHWSKVSYSVSVSISFSTVHASYQSIWRHCLHRYTLFHLKEEKGSPTPVLVLLSFTPMKLLLFMSCTGAETVASTVNTVLFDQYPLIAAPRAHFHHRSISSHCLSCSFIQSLPLFPASPGRKQSLLSVAWS